MTFTMVRSSFPIERENDTFSTAFPLTFNHPRHDRFFNANDFFDFFYFDLEEEATVTVRLQSIDIGQGYNLEVYNANKMWLGSGDNVGSLNEHVRLTNAPPGRYYALVIKSYAGEPTTDFYRIIVER